MGTAVRRGASTRGPHRRVVSSYLWADQSGTLLFKPWTWQSAWTVILPCHRAGRRSLILIPGYCSPNVCLLHLVSNHYPARLAHLSAGVSSVPRTDGSRLQPGAHGGPIGLGLLFLVVNLAWGDAEYRRGILFGLLVLVGLSLFQFLLLRSNTENLKSEILSWLKQNLRLIITVEILFFVAFALLALLRAGNPDLSGTERPMELMLLIPSCARRLFLRMIPGCPATPFLINYFGYVLTAMLAKLTSVSRQCRT